MSAYGRILVELRGEKSQSEVAKSVGIATSTLGMYETGQRIPRDGIKIALAKYYNTTVQRIFLLMNVTKKASARSARVITTGSLTMRPAMAGMDMRDVSASRLTGSSCFNRKKKV